MIIRRNVITIIMSITITPMGSKHEGWGGGGLMASSWMERSNFLARERWVLCQSNAEHCQDSATVQLQRELLQMQYQGCIAIASEGAAQSNGLHHWQLGGMQFSRAMIYKRSPAVSRSTFQIIALLVLHKYILALFPSYFLLTTITNISEKLPMEGLATKIQIFWRPCACYFEVEWATSHFLGMCSPCQHH